jgi:hypothetical protein
MTRPFISLLILLIVLCQRALSDDVHLVHGGRVEGEVQAGTDTGSDYVLETSFGARVTLAKKQVARVVTKSKMERRYEEMLPSVPDTEGGHLEMAERCKQAGLNAQRLYHLEQALRHNPDHEEARHALGFSRVDGRWMRQDEWMQRQGYERYRGAWRLPQEVAIDRAKRGRDTAASEWRKKLKNWRSWIVKGRGRQAEGKAAITAVRDPDAASALIAMLGNEKELRPLRVMYVQVLGQLPSVAAASALTKQALVDHDSHVREACLDQLERNKATGAIPAFIEALKHKENRLVLRGAIALDRMKDPAGTLPLINALITEHKQIVVQGGGIGTSFSPQAGGGLSAGGKREVKRIKLKNEPVLHALTALHPGVNFHYNQAAWKQWFMREKTPVPVNLRRGD